MERRRFAVDADVGHVTTGANEVGGELEGGGGADGFDGDVGAEPVGEAPARSANGVLLAVVHEDVGTEALGRLEPASARSIAMMWLGLKSSAP